jgi:hypothetical protein
MAKENVSKFYEAVAADEGLRARLNDLSKPYQGQEMNEEKKAALVEQLVLPIAAEMGWDFSTEELRQYEEEMVQASKNGELNDAELEAVAGGLPQIMVAVCFVVGVGGTVALGGAACWGVGYEV